MTAPTIRVHRDGTITADGKPIGRVYHDPIVSGWVAATRTAVIAYTRLRRDAINALLDHTYGKDRWS